MLDTCSGVNIKHVYNLSHVNPALFNVILSEIRKSRWNINNPRVFIGIVKLYTYIYREEEQTSTATNHIIKKICDNCTDIEKVTTTTLNVNSTDECSICYDKYNQEVGKLKCDHIFHKKCILKWLETSNTCPLCRENVIDCDECNGTELVYHNYHGVVIPIEHRGYILNRNTTNGIFGIFGYDLEDLVVSYMHYNRLEKQLTINIES